MAAIFTESVQESLELLGPYLVRGATLKEIAARIGRSEDYVQQCVKEIRVELEAALERSGRV